MDILKPADLDPKPRFYESLTDNPVDDMVGPQSQMYDGLLKLEKFIDSEVTVPEAIFDPIFLTTTPGSVILEEEHNIKGKIPIVYIYVSSVTENIVIPNAKTNSSVYRSTILNYDISGARTIVVRAYIYTLLKKNQ